MKEDYPRREEFVFFYNGPFSQWHESDFEIDGIKYNCAEQYMMAEKARLFNDDVAEQKIMEPKHQPAIQKAWGRKVRDFNKRKWEDVCKEIVFRGNYAKFSQNPGLANTLLATDEKVLVEASESDKIWGIGLSEQSPLRFDRKEWQGTNWLGEVLMAVRKALRSDQNG